VIISKNALLAMLSLPLVALPSLALAKNIVIAKNGHPNLSIWVTLYHADRADLVRTIHDSGCVPAGTTRTFTINTTDHTSNAYLRSELKLNADCRGTTLHDTTVNSGAKDPLIATDTFTLLPQNSYPQTYWAAGNQNVGTVSIANLPAPVVTRIFSRAGTNGKVLVLGIDPGNTACLRTPTPGQCRAILREENASEYGQYWERYALDGGYVFKNMANDQLLAVAPGNGNPIVLQKSTVTNMYAYRWTIGGNCASNCALRPIQDGGQNLNVFGGGPYDAGRAVGTWGWDGGGINETWTLSPAP